MTRFHALLSLILSILFISPSYSQIRCATVEYEKLIHPQSPKSKTEAEFEKWIQQKIQENSVKTFKTDRIQTSTYTVPVVVHIIHNGEAVGTGTNISDAQVISQINVLNKDYKRLNADASSTPAEFLPAAGSIDIEFVLAKQDPEGIATNGITRTKGTKTGWTLSDNTLLKSLSYWPAENYLNIWVTTLTDGYLGYAQLPVSNIGGLDDSSTDRLTDGVVINYKDFGSADDGSFVLDSKYNKGRTATHEIGHIFGLRHIWGDGNCATDYVDDTPYQNSSTSGCPANPQPSCDSPTYPHKMFQNYMDYSYDACMNIFTNDQVARMTAVINNSPRRVSLLSSPGATDPVIVANDLGIRTIITPSSTECNNPATPSIQVRNYGSNVITSAQVQLLLNGSPVETKTFSSLSLNPNDLSTFNFNPLNFNPSSSQQVTFQILQTNGGTDGKNSNDQATVQVNSPNIISLPFTEPFNSMPANWSIINPDGQGTWANITAPDASPTNKAMYLNYYNDDNTGTIDWLLTPSFTLGTPLSTQVRFDIAYSYLTSLNGDALRVYALSGCNPDLSQAVLLYNKSGSALSTTSSQIQGFTPTSNSQWRKSEVLSLGSLPSGKWQLAFIGNNGFGNNLYLDNVGINDQVVNDVSLTKIVSPGLVHCQNNPVIRFNVKNLSTSTITSFQTQLSINGGTAATQSFDGISLATGEEKTFSLNAVNLSGSSSQFVLTVTLPNGFLDTSPSNNSLTFKTYIDQTTDVSPLRQNFDNPLQAPWLIATPVNATPWQPTQTNYKTSMQYPAFTNTTIGEESWFVSPVLDLTQYSTLSLFFDASYAKRGSVDDRFSIIGSLDCGVTYTKLLMDVPGSYFSSLTSNSSWTPTTDSDWKRQLVSLDSVAGKSNVRLAFIGTNSNGNNLYIDNIEIYAGDDPNPPVTDLLYQFYYSNKNTQSDVALTFNLPQRQDVRLQIFTVMGQIVADNILPNTLNQTYYFDLGLQASGIYLFRLQFENMISTTKVFIGH